ncbi:MAG: hypothetical protein KF724_10080 [Phycisphaeraceae bacterium]|nr:hypothetical protein [Phycisphaeraceae bacterium]
MTSPKVRRAAVRWTSDRVTVSRHLAMAKIICSALLGATSLAASSGETPPALHATSWVSYTPGAGVPLSYQNPNSALGLPTRYSGFGIDPGVVSPFHPAFLPSEVVSIGPGGSLVLAFDRDVIDHPAHPFGIDLIVFGNSFMADLSYPEGVCGGIFSEGGFIDVSADGVVWHTNPGVDADGPFPTLGYLDSGPYDLVAGAIPSDFHRPVNPAHLALMTPGTTYAQLLALYNGSGGGAGVDLAAVGLSSARFVRIRVPVGHCCTVEIDAVTLVRPETVPLTGDLNSDGLVNGADLALLLGVWGSPGSLPGGGSADLNNDGVVDGADLAILLGAWSA